MNFSIAFPDPDIPYFTYLLDISMGLERYENTRPCCSAKVKEARHIGVGALGRVAPRTVCFWMNSSLGQDISLTKRP
ncbi:hypothetical protein [Candidatus Villigracilis saccharophilus]|uniref:hypothetical protein n=1 Tax=Candidatus Villigracilis saccharophilus TaxID=3140684 RepID=UPI0031364079|nr:hypothetical protein [Anaerolineales bacterium]